MSEQFMSINELARKLNCNRKTIRRHIDSGKLKAVRVGTRIRIYPEFVEDYLNNNRIREWSSKNI